MAIQLFMQATILLSNYYGYSTIRYSEIQARSTQSGFNTLPFMPPETVRATPELVNFFNTYENNPAALDLILKKYGGYKILVKYYIRTGLRASQAICRNYLLNLEERNQYLEFLQKEIGVAAALSTGILALVNANATLSKAFLIGRTGIDGAIDAYQEFRFLNIDREAARNLVETAQNKLGEYYLRQVDSAHPDSNSVTGGYTFSDALNAVSTIEFQCTRSGIRHLINRSIDNSPTNMEVDGPTGTVLFRSAKQTVEATGRLAPPPRKVLAPPPLPPAPAPAPSRVVVVEPTTPPPAVVLPSPGPVVVSPSPAPVIVPPSPAPVVVRPSPAPVVVRPSPAPVVVPPSPGPVVVPPSPGPVVVPPSPGPVVVLPRPDPGGVSVPAGRVCGVEPLDTAARRLMAYVCPGGVIVNARRDDLDRLLATIEPTMARRVMVVLAGRGHAGLRQRLLAAATAANLIPQ